jgi:hypothetical protein
LPPLPGLSRAGARLPPQRAEQPAQAELGNVMARRSSLMGRRIESTRTRQRNETVHRRGTGGVGGVCRGLLGKRAGLARGLRTWLRHAGVERAALCETTSVSRQLRWHDLRATTMTWLALDGATPTMIRDIAGHTQTAMTDRYMRAAAILRGGRFGQPFPAIPASLGRASGPGLGQRRSQALGTTGQNREADGNRSVLPQRSGRESAKPRSTGLIDDRNGGATSVAQK